MKVPRVDGYTAGVRAADEYLDVVVVGFGLGERVVQDDVDVVDNRLVGGQLGDDDAVAVAVEEMGETDHHNVVVVDERDADRRQAINRKTPQRVYSTARRGDYLEKGSSTGGGREPSPGELREGQQPLGAQY